MMAFPPRTRTILGCSAAAVPLLLLCVLCPGRLYGQVVGGTISGTITDTSGAVVANATVSMKNLATGVVTTVNSNPQGLYSLPNLLPGNYQETISASGFQTA